MSQYYKFEYWGYLMVKLDLVYKQPFSFYFIKISNIPHAYLILPNFPTPRLFGNQDYTISTEILLRLFFAIFAIAFVFRKPKASTNNIWAGNRIDSKQHWVQAEKQCCISKQHLYTYMCSLAAVFSCAVYEREYIDQINNFE